MKDLAPEIFRKRLLIEGFFTVNVNEQTIKDFFEFLTNSLSFQTYGAPIIHHTSGAGKDENQGYDAFVPLIDSGIYLAVWSNQKFFSLVIYTCKEFNEDLAVKKTREFFSVDEIAFSQF